MGAVTVEYVYYFIVSARRHAVPAHTPTHIKAHFGHVRVAACVNSLTCSETVESEDESPRRSVHVRRRHHSLAS